MYSIKNVGIFQISRLFKVADILYDCGKDMALKYDLHHWDNSHFKTLIIVALCVIKNRIYLVYDNNGTAIATFQIRKTENGLLFQKLATSPNYAGQGIGTYCMTEIENIAKELHLDSVCMEVYAPSKHAISFYEHKGYQVYGETKTLKYTELKMKKEIL